MGSKAKVMGVTGIQLSAFQAEQVLRFAASSASATEDNPLKLGNVEFWIGSGPWLGVLSYSIPTYAWDKESVQKDLSAFLTGKDGELAAYFTEKAIA